MGNGKRKVASGNEKWEVKSAKWKVKKVRDLEIGAYSFGTFLVPFMDGPRALVENHAIRISCPPYETCRFSTFLDTTNGFWGVSWPSKSLTILACELARK